MMAPEPRRQRFLIRLMVGAALLHLGWHRSRFLCIASAERRGRAVEMKGGQRNGGKPLFPEWEI